LTKYMNQGLGYYSEIAENLYPGSLIASRTPLR
jgi:hypothetical protein